MRTSPRLAAIALGLALSSSAYAKDPAPAAAPSAAKRYTTVVSGPEGRSTYPLDELWLEDGGIVVNVESRYDPVRSAATKRWESEWVANVFFGPSRHRYAADPLHAPEAITDAPLEDVRVDAELAKKIAEAADLQRRYEAARREVGAALAKAGLLPKSKPSEPVAPAK